MKTLKLTFATLIVAAAFAGSASAYTTVSITDTFIGGNPAGGTNNNSIWDGKDVVGDPNIFGIDSMNVVFNGSALSSVSIFTNYVKNDFNLGQYGTHLGDLFVSTNGYTTPTIYDTNLTGEQWEYALVLGGTNAHSSNLTLSNAFGNLNLYKVTSSNVLLSNASGTYRNNQEVEINTARNGLIASNVGTWSITGNELKFALTSIPDQLKSSDYGFHWGMSCGNDIIEGGASVPVPEPSTFVLLGAGLLGAGLARMRTRK